MIQDEQDMRDTDGEARTNTIVTFSDRPLHMDVPALADQPELTYNSSVQIQEDLLGAIDSKDR